MKVISGYVAVCLVWGTTWYAMKIGLESIPPFLNAALRFGVAAVVLAVLLRVRRIRLGRDRTFWMLGLMLGLLAFSVPFALVYWGQQHISSGLASILFATFPLCVAGISHFYLTDEKLTFAKVLGLIVGFAGIVAIFSEDLSIRGDLALWGMGAVVLSALLQAMSMVGMKKHAGPYSSFGTVFVGTLIGGILLGIASPLVEDYSTVRFDTPGIISILYLAIFGSVGTFVTYFWLLKHIETVLLSLTAFITPILAVLLGMILLNESFSVQTALGSTMVLAGILVINIREVSELIRRRRTRETSLIGEAVAEPKGEEDT